MRVLPDEINFAEYLLILGNRTATVHPHVGEDDSNTKTVFGKYSRIDPESLPSTGGRLR